MSLLQEKPRSQEWICKKIPDLQQVNWEFFTAEFLLLLKGKMHICAKTGLWDVEYTEIENFKYFVKVQDKKW